MKQIALLAAVVMLLSITSCGPKETNVERHIEINAPRAVVFHNFADFHQWTKWSPWYELDPNCAYTYYGDPGMVGHGYTWKSEKKDVGTGEMKITEATADDHIAFDLKFKEPWESASTGSLSVAEENGKSVVSWKMHMDHHGLSRVMMLFMDMDKMLGSDFEKGLAKMKTVDEAQAVQEAAKVAAEAAAAPADSSVIK
ncbi:MAG: SRPBCC family protein [Chitinophagales bacterium]